ncbi:MAG: AMP-binding protein [Alphaproteobacteria bacterium]|nr:AMP-binding protein [Alphaproteobacteria bacterium]
MFGTLVSGGRRLGGAALEERVRKVAGGLAALGIGPGDGVAIMMRNDFPFFEAILACGFLGAYPSAINWHFKAEEADYVLADCGAKVLVIHADLVSRFSHLPPGLVVLVADVPPEIARAHALTPEATRVPAGSTGWESWVAAAPRWDGAPRAPVSTVIYTSGTTGKPKGVKRPAATPVQQQEIAALRETVFGVTAESRVVLTGPLYHSAPNFYAIHALRAGATLVLQARFDPEEFLAIVENERVTGAHMVPTMFVRLLRLPDETRRKYDVSSLRHVVHGAAPCGPEIKRGMIAWLGPIVHEYYGATETGAVVHATSADWLAHPGTVGRTVPHATLRIYGEDGREVPVGTIGEVFVRLASYPDFTYQNRDTDRRAAERDGLISVGDMGYVDAEGYLYLCDRKRDMVISGGVNIYPAEIEHVLIGLAGVKDCAVFGVPDEEFGETLLGVVERLPGAPLDERQVLAHLRAHLANYKIPKRIVFQSDLPREDSGKIFKRRLREPYWAAAGRKI